MAKPGPSPARSGIPEFGKMCVPEYSVSRILSEAVFCGLSEFQALEPTHWALFEQNPICSSPNHWVPWPEPDRALPERCEAPTQSSKTLILCDSDEESQFNSTLQRVEFRGFTTQRGFDGEFRTERTQRHEPGEFVRLPR